MGGAHSGRSTLTYPILLVIALGSAVGDSMFYPDVPMIHALLVITVVVGFDKTLDSVASRSAKFSNYLTGKPACLVRNGVMEIEALEQAGHGPK